MESPKVLLISSANPLVTAGRVALDYYKAFLSRDVKIDFLTLYPVEGYPEIRYVYKHPNRWMRRLLKVLYWLTGMKKIESGYYLFYTYEQIPEVPVSKVLSRIDSHYDLVLVMFWQGMLSFKTIRSLYDKMHCQIHFLGVDYSQMSGGCHFTGDCLRYQERCGCCPAIRSSNPKDFTYHNVRYRERVYREVKPVVYGNTYMRDYFYSKAYLVKNARVEPSYDIYDLNEFCPRDRSKLRMRYHVPEDKSFIILFGCQHLNDPRKGFIYLINSLKLFWGRLSDIERSKVQIIVVGKDFDSISDQMCFDAIDVGFVNMSQMPELYALADVYLSPSINDAGPMMVNQALSCGTPVVAYEMGTALESIKGKGTGYCAKMKDAADFAQGIETIFRLPDEQRRTMGDACREYAEEHFSYSARVDSILSIYEKYNR